MWLTAPGTFPDAPKERGVKHIRELIKAKKADGKLIDEVAVKLCSLYVLGDDRNESSSC